MTRFIYSLISFLIALFFVLLGIIGALITWSSTVREIVSVIFDHSIAITLFSFMLILIGVAVAAQIIFASRATHYRFTVRNQLVKVDESVIQTYLNKYWQELFQGQEIPCHVTLKGNKIHVTADIPYIEQEQQEVLLTKIQQELGDLFGNLLGYRQEFYLAINFAK